MEHSGGRRRHNGTDHSLYGDMAREIRRSSLPGALGTHELNESWRMTDGGFSGPLFAVQGG